MTTSFLLHIEASFLGEPKPCSSSSFLLIHQFPEALLHHSFRPLGSSIKKCLIELWIRDLEEGAGLGVSACEDIPLSVLTLFISSVFLWFIGQVLFCHVVHGECMLRWHRYHPLFGICMLLVILQNSRWYLQTKRKVDEWLRFQIRHITEFRCSCSWSEKWKNFGVEFSLRLVVVRGKINQ